MHAGSRLRGGGGHSVILDRVVVVGVAPGGGSVEVRRLPHHSCSCSPFLPLALPSSLPGLFGFAPLSAGGPSVSLSDSVAAVPHVCTAQVHHPGLQTLLQGVSAGSLVLQQSVCPGKMLLAGVASVWLLSAVGPLVSLHVVLLDEAHVALVAAERFLSTVDLLVPLQKVLLDETHVALAAPEGPLACVDEDVSAQVVGAPEGGVAVLTDVRLGTRRQAASVAVQHH